MVKANLYRQNHTKRHTHTHSQKREKGKKNIYILKKKRKRATKPQQTNPPMIISTKY